MKLFESIRRSIKEADSGIEEISEKMDLIEDIYAEAGEEHETDPDVNDRVYKAIKDIIRLIEYKEVSKEEFDKLAYNHQAIDWSDVYEEAKFAKNINGAVSEDALNRILLDTAKEVANDIASQYNVSTKVNPESSWNGGEGLDITIRPRTVSTKDAKNSTDDYERVVLAQLLDAEPGAPVGPQRGVYYVWTGAMGLKDDTNEGHTVKILVDQPLVDIKSKIKSVINDAVNDLEDIGFLSDITDYRVANNINDAEDFIKEARNPENDEINELIRKAANIKGFAVQHKDELEKAGLKVKTDNGEVTLTGKNGRRLSARPYYDTEESYKNNSWGTGIDRSELSEPSRAAKDRWDKVGYEKIPNTGRSRYNYPSRAGGYNVKTSRWDNNVKDLKDWGTSDSQVAQRQLKRAIAKYGPDSPEVRKQQERLKNDRELMGLKRNIKSVDSYDVPKDADLVNIINGEPSYVNKDYTPDGAKQAQNRPLSDRLNKMKRAKENLATADDERERVNKRYNDDVTRADEYLRQKQLDHDEDVARATKYRNDDLSAIDKRVASSEDDLSTIRSYIKSGSKKHK